MKLLSILFPPQLTRVDYFQESCVAGRQDPFYLPVTESGVGVARPKPYANGIERMAAEGQ